MAARRAGAESAFVGMVVPGPSAPSIGSRKLSGVTAAAPHLATLWVAAPKRPLRDVQRVRVRAEHLNGPHVHVQVEQLGEA